MNEKMKDVQESLAREEKLRKELEESSTKLLEEKNQLFTTLESTKGQLSDAEERLAKLQSQKNDADRQLTVRRINYNDSKMENELLGTQRPSC